MTTESMSLADRVGVGRRFLRSVNLERDAGVQDALRGYRLTPAAHRALSRIADGLQRSEGDRAWSLVGPYGSGKSAFAVFLSDVLSPAGAPGRRAAMKLLDDAGGMPLPDQSLYPTLLTAERAPLDTMLLRALHATLDGIWKGQTGRKPKVLHTVRSYLNGGAPSAARCATSAVVHCFEDAARAVADRTGNGLLIVVDEAGKALEYAALEPNRGDIYLLQALAEAAARSDGAPFVLMTVLHQSFDHYAHQLGHAERNEWAKVQGRFGDLAFREGGDQLIRLTAEAITHTGTAPTTADWKRLVSTIARWVATGTGWNAERLERSFNACWPLHPAAAALLGPLFRGRLAQNERSLFAFLSSGEPFGFRDFLHTHRAGDLYTEIGCTTTPSASSATGCSAAPVETGRTSTARCGAAPRPRPPSTNGSSRRSACSACWENRSACARRRTRWRRASAIARAQWTPSIGSNPARSSSTGSSGTRTASGAAATWTSMTSSPKRCSRCRPMRRRRPRSSAWLRATRSWRAGICIGPARSAASTCDLWTPRSCFGKRHRPSTETETVPCCWRCRASNGKRRTCGRNRKPGVWRPPVKRAGSPWCW